MSEAHPFIVAPTKRKVRRTARTAIGLGATSFLNLRSVLVAHLLETRLQIFSFALVLVLVVIGDVRMPSEVLS